MGKITFMGAGSTVFAKNVIGDSMCCEALRDFEFALYDIDAERLQCIDFLSDDGFRKTELRNAVDEHAAGGVERLKDGDLIALLGQITGTG